MVDSGIPTVVLGNQTKKCETSPRPSEGRLCDRPGPMATQIHTYPTRDTTRSRQIFYTCCAVIMDLWHRL